MNNKKNYDHLEPRKSNDMAKTTMNHFQKVLIIMYSCETCILKLANRYKINTFKVCLLYKVTYAKITRNP